MPTNNEIRVNANNSTIQSTPGHDTAITLSRYDAQSILDLAHDLHAEEALEDAGFILSSNADEDMKADAARSLLHFYANVRCLVRSIEHSLKF